MLRDNDEGQRDNDEAMPASAECGERPSVAVQGSGSPGNRIDLMDNGMHGSEGYFYQQWEDHLAVALLQV